MTWADQHILHPSIVDDTRVRRTVDFANWARVRERADPPARFAIDVVARLVPMIGGRRRLWRRVFFAALFVYIAYKILVSSRSSPITVDTILGLVLMLLIGALVLWYVPRWNLWKHGPAIVPVLTAHGLCPCCGYSLQEAGAADGIVRCPECGGAWNESRFRSQDSGESLRAAIERIGAAAAMRRPLREDASHMTFALMRTPRAAAKYEPDPGVRARQLDAERAVRRAGAPTRWALIFVLGVFFALGFVGVITAGTGASVWTALVDWIRGYGVFAVIAFFIGRSYLGMAPEVAKGHMLSRGLCPTCASDLNENEPGEDGLCRCGVCGSVWRLVEDEAHRVPDTCFKCGYSLAGLSMHADGAVQCPECGTEAWFDVGAAARMVAGGDTPHLSSHESNEGSTPSR